MTRGVPSAEQRVGRLPIFLTDPFLRTVGVAALVAVAAELLLLPRLLALDATVWRAVLYLRGCGTDQTVDDVVTWTTWAAMGLLAAATVLRLRQPAVMEVWPPLALCAVGLHVGKVLKNVFARERPSMLPDLALGHSFPSGHVMNTVLAAIAIVVLAAGFRHPRRWWAAAAACVAIIFPGRLLLAHHWFLDALGGALAALALAGLALPWFRRRPLLAPLGVMTALTLVLTVVVYERSLGLRLPSPLSAPETGSVDMNIADAFGTAAMQGDWENTLERGREGPVAWLRGTGTLTLPLPSPDGVRDRRDATPVPTGWEAMLAMGARPDVAERPCSTVQLTVNGRDLPPFVPYVGWREYRILLPPGTLRPGDNRVQLASLDDRGRPRRFAIAYLRFDLD